MEDDRTLAHLSRISELYRIACPSLGAFYARKLLATAREICPTAPQPQLERSDSGVAAAAVLRDGAARRCLACGHERQPSSTRIRLVPKTKLRLAWRRCTKRPALRCRRATGFWAHVADRYARRFSRVARVTCRVCGTVARVPLGEQSVSPPTTTTVTTPRTPAAADSIGGSARLIKKKKKQSKKRNSNVQTAAESSANVSAVGGPRASATPNTGAARSFVAAVATPGSGSLTWSPAGAGVDRRLGSSGGRGAATGSGKKKQKDFHRQLSKMLTSDKGRAEKMAGGGLLNFLQSL